MPTYMLDTEIASYIMKRSNPAVLMKLQKVAVADVSISVVTQGELLYGVELSPRLERDQRALEEFLRCVEVLPLAEEVALQYAQLRANLKLRGTVIGANDLWIGAHTRSLGMTLVTNNVREFGRIDGLRLENWADSLM